MCIWRNPHYDFLQGFRLRLFAKPISPDILNLNAHAWQRLRAGSGIYRVFSFSVVFSFNSRFRGFALQCSGFSLYRFASWLHSVFHVIKCKMQHFMDLGHDKTSLAQVLVA